MAGFYTALIGKSPTIQWPGLSPPCTCGNQKIFVYNGLYPDPRFLNCLSDLQEGQNVPFGAVERK
jgi:hypothetical protein